MLMIAENIKLFANKIYHIWDILIWDILMNFIVTGGNQGRNLV